MARRPSMSEVSASEQRAQAACVRALDSYATVKRACNRVLSEMDEVTSPGGVPTTELSEEDSAVVVVREALELHKSG